MTEQREVPRVLQVVLDESDDGRRDVGLVAKWRRRGDRWEGLVVHEVDGRIVSEWLPALVLTAADST